MEEIERIKSPNCLDGNPSHDVGDGEIGDNNGMLFIACSRCFERFYLVSETALKSTGLSFVVKEEV